jgi:hypothetical protein
LKIKIYRKFKENNNFRNNKGDKNINFNNLKSFPLYLPKIKMLLNIEIWVNQMCYFKDKIKTIYYILQLSFKKILFIIHCFFFNNYR